MLGTCHKTRNVMMMMMMMTATTNISFNIIIICNELSLSSRYCNQILHEFYSPSLLSSQTEKKCNYKTVNGVKKELVRILIFYTGIKIVVKFRFWENISNTNDLLLCILTNLPRLRLKCWETLAYFRAQQKWSNPLRLFPFIERICRFCLCNGCKEDWCGLA